MIMEYWARRHRWLGKITENQDRVGIGLAGKKKADFLYWIWRSNTAASFRLSPWVSIENREHRIGVSDLDSGTGPD